MRRKVAAEPVRREQPLQEKEEADKVMIDKHLAVVKKEDEEEQVVMTPVNGDHHSVREEEEQPDTSADDIQHSNT